MARKKRQEPCEFCGAEEFGPPLQLPNAEIYVEKYPDNNCMAITVMSFSDDHETNGEETVEIELTYCPVCGRKLE